MRDCVFCDYFSDSPNDIVRAIEPLNPVVKGHMLFVPRFHVKDAGEDCEITSMTMKAACMYAAKLKNCNIITSKGVEATQSIFHLHIHVVPRQKNDELILPWTNQLKER